MTDTRGLPAVNRLPGFGQVGGFALAAGVGAFGSLDTALNIAFPDLVADFELSPRQLQWVVIFFVAASGGLLIPAGRLGDRLGHGRTVLVGAGVSVAGLLACAVSPTFGWFLAGRVVQGVGTATVMASAPALATLAAGPGRRDRAVGVFQTAAAVGLASGPIIGALFVLLLGWRGVFWFRIPLALALALATLPFLRRTAAIVVDPMQGPEPKRSAGGVMNSEAEVPGWRAAASLPVVVAGLLTLLGNGAMFATWLFVPTLLVDRLGVPVLIGGFVLAISPACTAVAAVLAPRLVARAGREIVAAVGLGVMALGAVALAGIPAAALTTGLAIPLVSVTLVLIGAGLGAFSVPNMATVMAAFESTDQGLAGAINLAMRTTGIVAGAAWHARLFDRLEAGSGFDYAFAVVFGSSAAVLAVAAVAMFGLPARVRPKPPTF